MKKVSIDKKYYLMRSIIVLGVYLLYSFVFGSLAGMFTNKTDSVIVNFTADVCFLAFVLAVYKDKLEGDIDTIHKNKDTKNRILLTAGWVIIIFIANIAGGFISSNISTDFDITSNNNALRSLPYIYVFFKTIIFSSIAEELVLKQSLRDVIDNNIIFIIVSTILYATLNIAYTSVSGLLLIANMVPYAIFAILSSILYLKNKDNIYVVMLVKICFNLIPFAILILGGVG